MDHGMTIPACASQVKRPAQTARNLRSGGAMRKCPLNRGNTCAPQPAPKLTCAELEQRTARMTNTFNTGGEG
jgi:hypothetical protein